MTPPIVESPRFCVDCRWHDQPNPRGDHFCQRPRRFTDLVTGENSYVAPLYCGDERRGIFVGSQDPIAFREEACGPDGKWWESKP